LTESGQDISIAADDVFILNTGDIGTGVYDFGGATSFEIPNSATPTVNAAGEIAIDTTITDHTGLIRYHEGTEELIVIAVPTDKFNTTDANVIAYNATNNEFEMTSVGGSGDVTGDTASADKEFVRFNGTGGKTIESPVTDLATTTATISDNADITFYDAVNDGNPIFAYGSSATERLQITASYASGTQSLEFVEFDTPTASATADRGEYRFKVDAALIATIDDGGIELADAKAYFIDTSNVLNETTLGSTVLSSSLTSVGTIATGTWEATDVGVTHGGTGASTAQAAIDTLSNVSAATDEHVLTKDTATGNATFKAAAGGGSMTTIKENDVQVGGADIVTLDFLGADFDLTESPDTEIQIVINDAGIDHDATANFLTTEHFLQSAIVETGALNVGSITSGFGSIDTGSSNITTTGSIAGITASDLVDKSAAEAITGEWDFSSAAAMKIPVSATPTVDANGEIAVDTTVTDFSLSVIKFFGGEEQGVVSMPIAEFTTPTGGHLVSYNATNDEFELVAAGAADNLGNHTATQDLAMAGFDIDNGGVIFLTEQAEANADVGGKGQIWVDLATPNILKFTDDAGTDFNLSEAASATIVGPIEIATAAETTTGTDATRAVSPDGLAGSEFGERALQMVVFDFTTDNATGDGKFFFHIDSRIAGMNLVDVHAEVITAGTTGTEDIQLRNVTQAADILSTKLTIDSTETGSDTAATAAVINAAEDDMQENDVIAIDVDAIQTTAAKGLIITLGFRLP